MAPMIKNYAACTFILTILTWGSHAQSITETVKTSLDQYSATRIQEKLYIHTDKEFYLAGELCWMKIYAVDAASHHPLDLSKVAYLEWLDGSNKPVLQTKIALGNGHGHGSVFLPLTLRSGNYKLRAYTSWMKNDGEDWFFEKNITIVNAQTSAGIPLIQPALKYELSFFPEGGDLVENLTSRIAFRISDQYGRGIECTGVITEDDKDTLLRFQPLKFGIGNFTLTPRTGHHYRAIIRLADGAAIAQLLPAAQKTGAVMTVTDDKDDHVTVSLQSTAPTPSLTLIAHTRRSIRFAASQTLLAGHATFDIDRKLLGDGISQLTVFDSEKHPVCERLVFKYPTTQLNLAINTDKNSYTVRQKINLQINSNGNNITSPTTAPDYSMAVYRIDDQQTPPTIGITDYLYLSSDLKGHIESAGYYFQHPEDHAAIDNLMMSHGWRRFRWDEVIRNPAPSFQYPPEFNGSLIAGTLVDTRTGKPAAEIQAYLSVPGTRTQFATTYSDNEGRVKFEMKDLYGSQEIIVQTNTLGKDSFYRVDIDNPFLEKYTPSNIAPFSLSGSLSSWLTENSISTQTVYKYQGPHLKQLRFPAVDTPTFYFKPDFSYLLDDYVRFTTMEEVMREYVKLMFVEKRRNNWRLPLYDLSNNVNFDEDPLILVDAIPVFDNNKLLAMDPLKVRKLEMVHRRFIYGDAFFSGIMNWTTYKGDLGGYPLDPRATVVDYEGLELEREFYAPSYEQGQTPEAHLPDFRNVLYWSPAVPVNPQGKGSLGFYTSDIPGKYLVVLEGMTATGATGTTMTTFEVK